MRYTGAMKRYLLWSVVLIAVTAGLARAERMTVDVPVANVRSGPGAKYDVIWKVEKYHPVMIVKKSGAWYRIRDFEQDEGWIHKSLLS